MARYPFTMSDLHWLPHSLGLSHIPGKTVMQNTFGTPVNQGIESYMSPAPGNGLSQQSPVSLPASIDASSEEQPSTSPNPFKSFDLGFLKGIFHLASVQVTVPFERVYLLTQCQNEMVKSGRLSSPYAFLFSKNKGLWDKMNYDKNAKNDSSSTKSYYLWFLFNHIPLSLLAYTLDFARTRLATDVKVAGAIQFSLDSHVNTRGSQAGCRQFTGVLDVWLKTLKSDGIFGLYRGYSLRFLEMTSFFVIGNAITYPERKQQKQKREQKQKRLTLATAISTCMILSFNAAFYPIYSVSRRMMMTSGEAKKYKSATGAIRQIVKYEGFSSLYKGVVAYIIYSGLTAAAFVLLSSAVLAVLKRKSR